MNTSELANLPPEEWERFRAVQIPFGLFGLDREPPPPWRIVPFSRAKLNALFRGLTHSADCKCCNCN